MKILVTGSNGLLGQKLVNQMVKDKSIKLIATSRGPNRLPKANRKKYTYVDLDVSDASAIEKVIKKHEPEVLIHTAAMTQVDDCEDNPEDCLLLNVTTLQYLIKACEPFGTHIIQLSTDFIFNGKKGPLTETDKPDPLSVYGQSKLESEQLLMKSSLPWSIARTVLVYGVAHDLSRSNIVLWIRQNLLEKKEIRIVTDQWRTPTLAEDLADGVIAIAKRNVYGIFNISGEELMTPYDMALRTARVFNLDQNLIKATDASHFTQRALRPPKTGFYITKARKELNYTPHTFEEGLELMKKQLK